MNHEFAKLACRRLQGRWTARARAASFVGHAQEAQGAEAGDAQEKAEIGKAESGSGDQQTEVRGQRSDA